MPAHARMTMTVTETKSGQLSCRETMISAVSPLATRHPTMPWASTNGVRVTLGAPLATATRMAANMDPSSRAAGRRTLSNSPAKMSDSTSRIVHCSQRGCRFNEKREGLCGSMADSVDVGPIRPERPFLTGGARLKASYYTCVGAAESRCAVRHVPCDWGLWCRRRLFRRV